MRNHKHPSARMVEYALTGNGIFSPYQRGIEGGLLLTSSSIQTATSPSPSSMEEGNKTARSLTVTTLLEATALAARENRGRAINNNHTRSRANWLRGNLNGEML